MLTRYWWNVDFEEMMTSVSAWLKEHANIQIVQSDWKYVHPTGQNQGKWYFVMIYKPG